MGSSPMGSDSDKRDLITEFAGALKKWTNYILGWQHRFFVLRQGNLLYYKSENDVRFGCRGAVNLSNASVVAHKFDECRFDVYISDVIWYLRCESPDDRRKWVAALTAHAKSPTSQNVLYPSTFTLTLKEKLQDVQSSRDRLSEKSERLLKGLDISQGKESGESSLLTQQNPTRIKHEINNFKDAIAELLSVMSSCVEMIDARANLLIYGREPSDASVLSCISSDSPEMVEGQHCLLGDEEFFDAVESSLEKIEEEAAMRKKFENIPSNPESMDDVSIRQHPLWGKISEKTEEQIKLATTGLNETWELLLDEDDMKIYSKEVEVDGLVTDPLTAVCTVKGVTGREVCHYFFCPQYRKDWELTVEQMDVVERIGQDVIVFHQVYKRVWPTAQRDTLFWSHLVRRAQPGSPDAWAVVNDSLELPQVPANDGKLVRVTFTACLHCVTETVRSPPVSRDDVACRLTYCTVVNPGGWVPASAVRALRRKEYPKFLKKFTSYVVEKTANAEIMI